MKKRFVFRRNSRMMGLLAGSGVLLAAGFVLLIAQNSVVWNVLGAAAVVLSWLVPVLFAVRYKTRSELGKMATREDVRQAQRAMTASVEQTRKNSATSRNRQERALLRIEEQLHILGAIDQAKTFQTGASGVDILFATSNGAGLGHISRLMAIAHQLPNKRTYEILTLSTAYRQAAEPGMTVHYFPSREASGESSALWNKHFRAYLLRLVASSRPRVVVFDGTWVYAALTDICRAHGIPVVWVQRGMWRAEVDHGSIQRHDAARVADHVIVPGDYAGNEKVDVGKKILPDYVGPIVMTTRDDLLARDEACAALGLDSSRRYVMLNLGGGSISDPASLAYRCRELLHALSPDFTPVQVVSPLAVSGESVPGVLRISAYPVMPHVNAFEFMICAAGYNSAQEAASLGVPAILVPNAKTRTDDQVRRARELTARGLCFIAEDEPSLREALGRISDPIQRARLRHRLAQVETPRGALEAAMILDEMIDHAGWTRRAMTLEGPAGNGA